MIPIMRGNNMQELIETGNILSYFRKLYLVTYHFNIKVLFYSFGGTLLLSLNQVFYAL